MKCLDTYTLVEIEAGNPKFAKFLNEEFVITDLTMAEFYGDLYKKYDQKTAEYWLKKLSPFCQTVSRDIIIQAVQYRIDNKSQNLSFFDCIGYLFSLHHNIKFVTGDKEFRHKENVEFIQK
ncbi:hypothetical protein A2642_02440 [Candidatus Nomurabacteria bacterium RIFCSPHIGHO2_01_FULL_39_10]|uniref:PIN domain-containing protein n=1 Tax=Candidatus Nomurabacteria bacterium RIFCSPHIGHO2_01_FULL_39_10 TaxID=1801733 RepID=A0A1F6V5Y9_9BACT|nr:MAG: hypothetical protein A2642_02440 [Candidatus Nomurabacteria bacterium RIFCSPHIGHO2_01_FULL_39_10]